MRKLLTVEDVFLIEGRGVTVLPALPFGTGRGVVDNSAELRRRDGSVIPVQLRIDTEHFNRPLVADGSNWRRVCSLTGVEPSDVHVGSDIWCADEVVQDALDGEHG